MEINAKRRLSDTHHMMRLIVGATPRNIRCKHIVLLLKIAQRPGLTVSELSQDMPPYSLASIAKLIHEMSPQSWRRDGNDHSGKRRLPGFGLVRLQSDPRDHRVRRVYLSPKGESLIQDIIHIQQENTS